MGRQRRQFLPLLLSPLLLPLFWLGLAFLLGAMPSPISSTALQDDGVEIALVSNGWHVDLILPLAATGNDLASTFPHADAGLANPSPFIAIGWGDRDFYLETPRLADLKPRTALNALLGRGPAVLHVAHLSRLPETGATRKLVISQASFAKLANAIADDLQRDQAGRPILIQGAGYGVGDAFYEAQGHYSPLLTCNEWLGRKLRAADLPTGLWSPLPNSLMRHWPPAKPYRSEPP